MFPCLELFIFPQTLLLPVVLLLPNLYRNEFMALELDSSLHSATYDYLIFWYFAVICFSELQVLNHKMCTVTGSQRSFENHVKYWIWKHLVSVMYSKIVNYYFLWKIENSDYWFINAQWELKMPKFNYLDIWKDSNYS